MLDFLGLDIQDFIYAALLALCLTWLIKNFIKLRKVIRTAATIAGTPKDIASVMERCYKLFPLDKISFKGETFTRGMQIKVITINDTDFEGELIGGNTRNMVCIKTKKCIIAHEIQNIRAITKL